MGLLLSVDDSRNAAYKVLAEVWREHCHTAGEVKIEFHTGDEIETATKMRRIVESAVRKDCHCVMFVVDQEPHDPGRRAPLQRIVLAFEELCKNLPTDITVGLIVAYSCLECWLLTDVQAIAHFQSGGRGLNYRPNQSGQTERYNPIEAVEEITNIMRQVARERGVRDLKRVKYEKSRAGEIAQHIQCLAAKDRNESLKYFLEMILCDKDGCAYKRPQPE